MQKQGVRTNKKEKKIIDIDSRHINQGTKQRLRSTDKRKQMWKVRDEVVIIRTALRFWSEPPLLQLFVLNLPAASAGARHVRHQRQVARQQHLH